MCSQAIGLKGISRCDSVLQGLQCDAWVPAPSARACVFLQLEPTRKTMKRYQLLIAAFVIAIITPFARAAFVTFEAAGPDPAAITSTRDAFRTAAGGGSVAGANGD